MFFCKVERANNRQIKKFYSFLRLIRYAQNQQENFFIRLSLKKSKGMCGKTIWEFVREYYVKSEVGLLGVVDT